MFLQTARILNHAIKTTCLKAVAFYFSMLFHVSNIRSDVFHRRDIAQPPLDVIICGQLMPRAVATHSCLGKF